MGKTDSLQKHDPETRGRKSFRLGHVFIFVTLDVLQFVLLCACTSSSKEARLTGLISGVRQLDLLWYAEDAGDFVGIDTLALPEGRFAISSHVEHPTLFTLSFPNGVELPVIVEPQANITIKGSASALGEMEIKGTEENEMLTAFRQGNIKKSVSQRTLAAAAFIREHPETMAAYAVFKQYFAKRVPTDTLLAIEMLDTLRLYQPDNYNVQRMSTRLRPLWATRPGQDLPYFTATTLDSTIVCRDSLVGKPSLIVFFAAWDKDCEGMLDLCRSLKKDFGEDFHLLLVSLDSDPCSCKKQLDTDSLPAHATVCDALAMESELAQVLGFRWLPDVIFADKQGLIVARGVPTAAMREQLASLIHYEP